MRLHTDVLTRHDILKAAGAQAGVYALVTEHGSRSHERAFEVALRGVDERHTRRTNSGSYGAGDDFAATWSDWGRFYALLFAKDPCAKTTYYADAEAFDEATFHLFSGVGEVDPAVLADEVRELHRRAPNCGRRQPIAAVAHRRGLPEYIVTAAIFGE